MKTEAGTKNPCYLICALLILITSAVYWQVSGFEFTNVDDQTYVVKNAHIHSGLTIKGIEWALTSFYASNWHPLTWMSHMLDWQMFGRHAGGHHVTNLLFHIASTLLLFWILKTISGCPWRSGFVALLFAIHPVHVESVAWVAERKDVLSAFFWMLIILVYVRYASAPSLKRYLLVLFTFALGLMAKPMLVTLPLVLLLLDYWPLGRWNVMQRKPIIEKLPLLALALASCILTYLAQRQGSAVASLELFPVGVRAANASVAVVGYLGKMLSPLNLAMFYPHPGDTLPVWQVAGSVLLITIITYCAFRFGRKRPYLLVGWLWYLITLLPVIGLVQVGMQAMADRYTYIPLIGPFIMITWLIPDIPLLHKLFIDAADPLRRAGQAAAAALVAGLVALTYFQVGYWRDTITLCEHAITVTDNNYFAYYTLGKGFFQKHQLNESLMAYSTALKMKPTYMNVRYRIGSILSTMGRYDLALKYFQDEAENDPKCAEAYQNMAYIYMNRKDLDTAYDLFNKALELKANYPETYYGLGCIAGAQNDYEKAIRCFSKALELDSHMKEARVRLKMARECMAKQKK